MQQTHFSTRTQREKIFNSKKKNCTIQIKRTQEIEKLSAEKNIHQTSIKDLTMADNQMGVQTRSMTHAQCNNPDQMPVPEDNPTPAAGDPTPTANLDPQNPALNPVVELRGIETSNLIEYVRNPAKST